MTVFLLPNGQQVFLDNNGEPLAGGKVYHYIPSTTTFKNTWQDAELTVLNTNPVILDSAGRATIWGDGDYRQVAKDSLGNTIWDKETLTPGGAATECGPVLYAGVSTQHAAQNADHQDVQFQYCNMVEGPDAVPANNTMITFIAGVSNVATDPFGFHLYLFKLNGDPVRDAAYEVFKNSPTGPVVLELGDIIANNAYFLVYDEVEGVFILTNPGSAGTIANHSITNAKLAQVTGPVIKGRNVGSLGDVLDLTPTQTTAMLDVLVGDSGSGGTAGLVPAPAAGDAAAGRFLKADGTWAVPAGGGGGGGAPDTADYFLGHVDGALTNGRLPTDTATISWDVSVAGEFKANIVGNSIGSAQLAQMSTQTFLGRTSGGTGNTEELTATQATAILNAMVGDSGSGGTKGLVPAPAAGDTAAGKFLKADGSWSAPSGSGAPSTAEYIVKSLDSGLSAERALTNANGVTWDYGTADQAKLQVTQAIQVAASDESTALTAGTAKVTFRMPFAFTLTAIRASLTTAQASGSIFTVDVNEGGVSILSTKLTIDNTELTSTTAATPPVISDSALADDAEITVDIDQVGDGTATGLKVTLIGYHA